jgi:hypothetical protein
MGISYQHKRQRNTLEILRSELSSDCEIVASCIRSDCAYLAIKRGDMVMGSVTRLYRSKHELGIKWIDEDMGPYYYECPRRVLDCLTPTECARARNWRASCYGWNARNERLNHDLSGQLFQYNDRKYRIDKKVPKSPGYYVTDMGTGFQYRISRKQLFKAEWL